MKCKLLNSISLESFYLTDSRATSVNTSGFDKSRNGNVKSQLDLDLGPKPIPDLGSKTHFSSLKCIQSLSNPYHNIGLSFLFHKMYSFMVFPSETMFHLDKQFS